MGQYDRERSPVRAGLLTQVLAESGRFVCAVLGLVVMTFLAAAVAGPSVALLRLLAPFVPVGVGGGAPAGETAPAAGRGPPPAPPPAPPPRAAPPGVRP